MAERGDPEGKTKIRTLLEHLDTRGNLDAHQLESLTGFKRPLIVATMHCAKQRGMVEILPHDGTSRRTGRGQVYAFISYVTVTKPTTPTPVQDTWDEDLKNAFEKTCMPGLRKQLQHLDRLCTSRRVVAED